MHSSLPCLFAAILSIHTNALREPRWVVDQCSYVASVREEGAVYWGGAKPMDYCYGARSDVNISHKYYCDFGRSGFCRFNRPCLVHRTYTESTECDDDTEYEEELLAYVQQGIELFWYCDGNPCVLDYRTHITDCAQEANQSAVAADSFANAANLNTEQIKDHWYDDAIIPGKCSSHDPAGNHSVYVSCDGESWTVSNYGNGQCSGTPLNTATYDALTTEMQDGCKVSYEVMECDMSSFVVLSPSGLFSIVTVFVALCLLK
mmetsp:Transcript_2959/g.4932  ORF Transcript_2959/g.4932 Transcript_2959/m.4932 type:complete len:261 (-) Transcript_2959:206-988(-)